MFRVVTVTLCLTSVLVPVVATAAETDISPALRVQAQALCRDDALRLCADAIPDESAIITCMRPKRALLTTSCRKVFDQVMKDVRR